MADGEQIAHMPGHGDKVHSLAVAPDGTIASGDWSGEIRLWDGKTGAAARTLARQGTAVGSLSFSPDGRTLLSGVGTGGDGFRCHVYDLAGGREIARYSGHDNVVPATAISIITETFTFGEPVNTVEVTASNRSEVAFSDPARVTIRMEDGVRFDAPELYVLAIGADKYRVQKYELDYAVKDATTFAGQIAAAGEPFYRSRPHVMQLTDHEVTAGKLDAAFAELARKVKPTDVFIFYIAGHGKAVGVDNDYYFLPPAMTDFTDEGIQRAGIGPEHWQAWTTRIKASKQIWIYDTCDSGAIRGVLKKRGGVGALETAYLRLKDATGRVTADMIVRFVLRPEVATE